MSELVASLQARSSGKCELCQAGGETGVLRMGPTEPGDKDRPDRCLVVCDPCRDQMEGGALEANRWHSLKETIWSDVPPIQAASYRLLHRLKNESWAADLLDTAYLEEDLLEWAQAGLQESDSMELVPDDGVTRDCNGNELSDDDSVTLIKNLEVKGGGFTAKRGTMVKHIRLTDDSGHVEGKVGGMLIVLKTEFLKKA